MKRLTCLSISRRLWIIIILLVVLLSGHLQGSVASTITVTSNGDSGDGTLRQAVIDAFSGDTINFELTYPSTITLTSGQIVIDKSLTIIGPEAENLIVSGNNTSRIFQIAVGCSLMVYNLTISDGNSGLGTGGSILNQGELYLSNCVIKNNISNSYGGGIANEGGFLSFMNCTISNNTANVVGGGICNVNGMLIVTQSTVNGNSAKSAGGIMNMTIVGGPAITGITNSTISGNHATESNGGGIGNQPLVSVEVNPPMPPFTLPDVPGFPFPNEEVGIEVITIITDCTITNNTATNGFGGGIYGSQGIQITVPSFVMYQNTIIAGNSASAGKDCYNASGTMQSQGYCLLGVTISCESDTSDINIGTANPKLRPLANNGGPTLTHALLTGCLAINTGATESSYDQRVTSRPQGAGYDIGAFEAVLHTVTFTAGINGNIMGTSPQTIPHGASSISVTAVPDDSYYFTGWSGNYTGTENPLTATNVTSNMNITANFAINMYTVIFTAGEHGSISGTAEQTLYFGENCTEVTAVPETGYHFTGWSGDYIGIENPLTITNVTSDMNITANFSIDTYSGESIPYEFSLSQNYPNPFNMSTTLTYSINADGYITICIYNTLGQPVRKLVNNEQRFAGKYSVQWDGTDNTGQEVTSGIYFVTLYQSGRVDIKRIVFMK